MSNSLVEMYKQDIAEEREYLFYLAQVYRLFLFKSEKPENKKIVNKQRKIFLQLEKNKINISKYKKKTEKNFKNNEIFFTSRNFDIDVREEVIKNLRCVDECKKFLTEEEVIQISSHHSLESAIEYFGNQYISTKNHIQIIKEEIEEERKNHAQEFLDKFSYEDTYENIDIINSKEKSSVIPFAKKISIIDRLRGKDVNVKNMGLLYGLAFDIFMIMSQDQRVDVKRENDFFKFINIEVYSSSDNLNNILKKYNVNSVENLLNLYEKVRTSYFEQYSKLSDEMKKAYKITNLDEVKIYMEHSFSSYQVIEAATNEGFVFPPSKQELIHLVNDRIFNGTGFEYVEPKKSEYGVTAPKNSESYYNVYKYYKNLTKNMSIEEITLLYVFVFSEKEKLIYKTTDEDEKVYWKSVIGLMQKLFAEVIMDKKGIEFVDIKQKEEVLAEIVKTILEQDLKFSSFTKAQLDTVSKEERHQKIYSEYVKYLATQKNKKKAMKFSEFIRTKYALSKDEETIIIEEIKGKNK